MRTSPTLLSVPNTAVESRFGSTGGPAGVGSWLLRERSRGVRYGVAILCVLGAWLIRWLVSPAPDDNLRFCWFVLAVMVAASLGGWGPGLLATGLLALGDLLVANVWAGRDMPGSLDIAWLLVFLMIGIFSSVLSGAMRSAYRRLETERQADREAHAALRDSERRCASLLDQAALGMCLASADGRLLAANRKLYQMLGYSDDELLQRSLEELTFAEDWPAILAQHMRLRVREIDHYSIEKRALRKDGSLLWAQFTCWAIRGDTDRVIAIIEDISDRKRAEEALRESEEIFRTMAEHAHVCIGIMQGTRLVYANPYFATLIGYSVEEIVGMDFMRMVHPSDRQMMLERGMRRFAGQAVPNRYEFLALTKSGEERWVDFSPALSHYRGKPAIIGTGFDVTDRKLAETSLRQSEARLAEAKEAAEAASRAKDHFLAILSHELRTPLTPVLAAATILSGDHRLPPEAMEDVEMIRRNVELEARLIDDLLDLTRIARGKLELKQRDVNVGAVLRHAIEICGPDIDAKDLHLRFDPSAVDCWVRADPSRLQQVLWNIIKNAVKFTPQGGCIGVRCLSGEAGRVTVEVSDSGVGIEPEVLPRIFGAFEQGARTVTREFGGLGLGLAICKALVEMHGGTISAQSDGRGKGATFRVELPTIPSPAQEQVPDAPAPSPEHPIAPRRPRILLVEDHVDTARVLGQLLAAYGYDVRTAGTVAAALDLARSEDFDLILSDLGLPDGSGLGLIQAVHHERPALKGIALSGYGMDEDVARSREAGFADHLTKPINPRQLEEALERAVGRFD